MRLWIAGILVLALHGAWQDHYTGAGGIPCCGALDCVKVYARIVEQTSHGTMVEVNDTTLLLPHAAVHQSEDLHDWLCQRHSQDGLHVDNIRCLFIAIGG